jgi:hypothetical protein
MGEIRTIRALATFLSALGTKESPAIIILDDCQWADELTLKLLRYWFRQLSSDQPVYVILVAAFRREEVDQEHALRQIPSSEHLELALFDQAKSASLRSRWRAGFPKRPWTSSFNWAAGVRSCRRRSCTGWSNPGR